MKKNDLSPLWRAEAHKQAKDLDNESLLDTYMYAKHTMMEGWGEEARIAETQYPILREAVLNRMNINASTV